MIPFPSFPFPLPLFPNPPTPIPSPGIPLYWLIEHSQVLPRASSPIDNRLGHPLLHIQLEPHVPPCVFFDWWYSSKELWEYWLVHIDVPPMGLQSPSAPWVLSLAPSLGTSFLYLPGTGRASQETAISDSCQ